MKMRGGGRGKWMIGYENNVKLEKIKHELNEFIRIIKYYP